MKKRAEFDHDTDRRARKVFSTAGKMWRGARLDAVFQPIFDINKKEIIGHEGLIRPISSFADITLTKLFSDAASSGVLTQLNNTCQSILLKEFLSRIVQGKLFLNSIIDPFNIFENSRFLISQIVSLGIQCEQIVVEISQNEVMVRSSILQTALEVYRACGFKVAISDLTAGFSGVMLWSEWRPDFIKINQSFIRGAYLDPSKAKFVRALLENAEKSGATVIADGVESRFDFAWASAAGIPLVQGNFVGEPYPFPPESVPMKLIGAIESIDHPRKVSSSNVNITVERLLRFVDPVTSDTTSEVIYSRFQDNPDLQGMPVLDGKRLLE